ncbi:MAG: hypothetical protein MI747_15550 [Desulfobacterales bacterium]|nr:hypothetical protein [Desulfobacterales bacterium]
MTQEAPILPVAVDEKQLELKQLPEMPKIFARAMMIAPFRGKQLKKRGIQKRGRIVFNGLTPNPETQALYRRVCGFSTPGELPPTYFQTLFVELLGKYIVSPLFPLTPLGLIHTGQSIRQERPILPHEALDLSCALLGMETLEKGVESRFHLCIHIKGELVWQGISTFFTRSGEKTKSKKTTREDIILKPRRIFKVAKNTGRRYAKASGDMNPHHLYGFTAKFFGFKQPIAHGMWSLGRSWAGIERELAPQYPITLEAQFKLPIFMPATLALGWEELPPPERDRDGGDEKHPQGESTGNREMKRLAFELRDRYSHLPHLKGQCSFK